MTYSTARAADGGQTRGNATSALMLSELQEAHEDLQSAMAAMDGVTREPAANRNEYSSARWRLSQASLKRRTLWARIFEHLRPRAAPRDAEGLKSLHAANLETLRHSAAHVGKWTIETIEADWPGYCEASRAIRWNMKAGMGAEKRVLYPLLTDDALGIVRR